MKVYEENNQVIVEDIKDFHPQHIFECGQCFRWDRQEDGSYTGVAFKKVVNVRMEHGALVIKNTNIDDFYSIWKDYFDLDRDYSMIKERLSRHDKILKEAVQFGWGIRILKQDVWECLVSFIISSNNLIPRIKKIINNFSEKYGQPIVFGDKVYYSFPEPNDLYDLSVEDLSFCRMGYRDQYIMDAVQKVKHKVIDLENLKHLPTSEAKKELMKIKGIGPKVADCILLFSLQKYDIFPTDVWVRRVMQHFYLGSNADIKDVQKYSDLHYGDLRGFAQQYLFYYAREQRIGK